METREISLPYKFKPREYQKGIMTQIPKYYSRGVFVHHRRAGKDRTAWNKLICEAAKKKAIYYYFFPTYRQGRKAIWDGIDPSTGMSFLDHIPKELLAKKNDTEMKITLSNGSLIQIVGTDDYNAILGTPPYGCVFSEYSLQDPRAWEYIKPILRENKGWAIFLYTPRGKNHGYDIYIMAQNSEDWYAELLTIRDTKRDDETPVLSEEDIKKEREEGMAEEMVQQEYFCSFTGFIQGNYYSKQIEQAVKDERIGDVPHVSGHEVYTAWDLGMDDSTTIWFFQAIGLQIRLIDYYENSGEGLSHYMKIIKEKSYVYGDHYLPHDVEVRELGTGISRRETLINLGLKSIITVKRARDQQSILNGIEAGRNLLSRCWFDKKKCVWGIKALENYRAEYDEEKRKLGNAPEHDWSSHGCFVGDTQIITKKGLCSFKNLPFEGEVLTLKGWKKYQNPRITRKEAQLAEVCFKDGKSVKCTPDHLFLIINEFKAVKNIAPNTKIRSALHTTGCLFITRIKKVKTVEDVWDITVPEVSHFSLFNGAVVHNSDAFRTLAVGFQPKMKSKKSVTEQMENRKRRF